jgi:hypothetical protein
MRKRADEVARSETDGVETFHWSPRILTVDGTKIEQLLAQNALAHPEQGSPQQRPKPAGIQPRSPPDGSSGGSWNRAGQRRIAESHESLR